MRPLRILVLNERDLRNPLAALRGETAAGNAFGTADELPEVMLERAQKNR